MKKIFSVLVMAMCLTGVAKAQIYGSGVYYYVPAGENITRSTTVKIAYFNGRRAYFASSSCGSVLDNINRNSSYFINEAKKVCRISDEEYNSTRNYNCFAYDSSISTSSKEVYKKPNISWHGTLSTDMFGRSTMGGYTTTDSYSYRAVSDDKETLICWDENTSNEIRNKQYFTRVDVKDLAPKPANRDFLYD